MNAFIEVHNYIDGDEVASRTTEKVSDNLAIATKNGGEDMKIDSIDIRSFDAKQLTVDFEPPQTGVTVEMFDGALIPSESETYTPLSGLTVTVLFRGKDRDEVQKHVSDFNAELQKGVVLTLDGYSRHFKAYMTGNSLSKTITKTRYTAEFKFTGTGSATK